MLGKEQAFSSIPCNEVTKDAHLDRNVCSFACFDQVAFNEPIDRIRQSEAEVEFLLKNAWLPLENSPDVFAYFYESVAPLLL